MSSECRFAVSIKSARMREFSSAKAFWDKKRPSCSYYQYSLIEKGTDLPAASLAAELIRLLNLDLKATMYVWVQDSMPTSELRELFMDSAIDIPNPSEVKALASVGSVPLLINRMQTKLLVERPNLHEMLSFMNTFSCSKEAFSPAEVAVGLGIGEHESRHDLELLYDYGLVDLAEQGCYSCKRHVTVPAEPDLELSSPQSRFFRAGSRRTR